VPIQLHFFFYLIFLFICAFVFFFFVVVVRAFGLHNSTVEQHVVRVEPSRRAMKNAGHLRGPFRALLDGDLRSGAWRAY